jgi:hypothetical protein
LVGNKEIKNEDAVRSISTACTNEGQGIFGRWMSVEVGYGRIWLLALSAARLTGLGEEEQQQYQGWRGAGANLISRGRWYHLAFGGWCQANQA